MPAVSKVAIRHSQKLLGRTSTLGAFMTRLLHICFRRRPCGLLALLSRTFRPPFLATLICYRIDFLLTRRQHRMGNWTPMMARSAHRLRGATAEAIQEIVALPLPTNISGSLSDDSP